MSWPTGLFGRDSASAVNTALIHCFRRYLAILLANQACGAGALNASTQNTVRPALDVPSLSKC